jgi:heptosyltransferase-2/heptosyltransferase-3
MRTRLRLWFLRASGALLRPLARRIPAPGRVRRILIIRPDQLGDVLLSLPAIETLAQALPDAHFTLAVGPWGRPALGETPPGVVLLCPFPGFSRAYLGPVQPYLLLLRYGLRLRRQRAHDMAVVLRPDHWWGAFLACLAGIPLRVGYDMAESLPFLTTAVPRTPGRHAAVDALDLAAVAARCAAPDHENRAITRDRSRPVRCHAIAVAGPENTPITPAAFPLPHLARERDHAVVRDLLRQAGVADVQDLVVLHPGSNSSLKAWTLERLAAVGQRLAIELGVRVLVTGLESERNHAQRLCDLLPSGALNLAGRLSWTELEALLARATLVVGVDNGSLHLAVAVGTASVALFGPADPAQFGPWGSTARHRVVTADLPCRPCRRLDFCAIAPGIVGPPPCMRAIDVDQVLDAAHAALANVP